MTTFHHVMVRAKPDDAITNMALQTRDELRRLGPSEVYARHVETDSDLHVLAFQELPPGQPSDVVIYHSSVGDPAMTKELLARPGQVVLVYHGTARSDRFAKFDGSFATELAAGHDEIRLLSHRVDIAIAVSKSSADDLRQLGYARVHTAVDGVHPDRLTGLPTDVETALKLDEAVGVPFVLAVSALLPRNCQHVLLQALHVLQSVHRRELGLVLVGSSPDVPYAQALHRLPRDLRIEHVWFAGRACDSSLATIYRRARLFSSASDEGLLELHPLEAMTFGVPTIIRKTNATAESAGGGALMLPRSAGPLMFAEALLLADQDDELRSSLIEAGFDRARTFSTARRTQSPADVIEANRSLS